VQKSSPKNWASFEIFQKLPKVNNRPMGENSSNLVTLTITDIKLKKGKCEKMTSTFDIFILLLWPQTLTTT
jgi:hypothetical protein